VPDFTRLFAYAVEEGPRGDTYYSTASQIALTDGGIFQKLQGGAIYWTAPTGAHISVGGIRSSRSLNLCVELPLFLPGCA
jgi:uncharacterized protein with LGFP repeats